ncbi:MAG TPA: VOC family protein, partial [Candidatus Acidoferrum sp.]|nr:VOC family protein [Candidatus Acidoferrum sp.]
GEPFPLTRDRPDGYHLSWVLATPEPPFNGQLPFLIKDDTPRDERVPRERSHRNGATGIRTLALAVKGSRHHQPLLCARAQTPGHAGESHRSGCRGRQLHDRSNELQLLASKTDNGSLAQWIRDRGQSPFELVLANASAGAVMLDPALLQGARIRIA